MFQKNTTVLDKIHVIEKDLNITIPQEVIDLYIEESKRTKPRPVFSVPYLIPLDQLYNYNTHLLESNPNEPVLFEMEDYEQVWDNTYYEHEATWNLETLSYTTDEDPMDKLLNGMLIIYHHGCTFFEAIILYGKYKGRRCIICTDYECGAPELLERRTK